MFLVLLGLIIFIAWSATEPNPYMIRPGTDPAPQSYPWGYPVWLLIFGIVVIGLSSLRAPRSRFVGAVVSFILGSLLSVELAMTSMHSPSVQGNLLYIMFFSSLGLLFYSGYTCAMWRSKSQASDSAS